MLLPDWHAQRTFLAHLDVLLSIYDGAGNLVAASDATGLPGALNTTLPAGTYYVAVDGTAQGDPLTSYNDYDSLGQYTLTGTVQPTGNQAPVAVASASVTSGSVPLDVVFSSAGSYDPDGSIVAYDWDFGDGSAPSSAAAPSHTYTTAGTYIASLAVFDNGGLSATATVTINVSTQAIQVSVDAITMSVNKNRAGTLATAVVTVKDSNGAVVPNASVSGTWSGLFSGKSSGVTNSSGQVAFSTKRVKGSGTFTFSVTSISVAGGLYDPTQNTMTSASIATP